MTTLKDSIEIKATPQQLFSGLIKVFSSEEIFKAWHKGHEKCQWIKGDPFEVGSVLYVEEYLHGKLHKLKFVSTKLEPGRKIEFRLLFPASIICSGGSFAVRPEGEGSIFSATLSFRMGWLFSVFAGSRIGAIKYHMKEEGESLKMLLEKGEI